MKNNINFKSLIKESFDIGTENYIPLLLNLLFYGILGTLLLFSIVGILIYPAICCSVMLVILKCARGQEISIPDSYFDGFKNNRWWKLGLFYIIWSVAVMGGFLLLIIPGFYLMIISTFSFLYIIEEPNDTKNAFKKSRNLVKKIGFWKIAFLIFAFSITTGLLGLLPAAIFGFDYMAQISLGSSIINVLFNMLWMPFFASYICLIYLKGKELLSNDNSV